jgi:hypothetical protein
MGSHVSSRGESAAGIGAATDSTGDGSGVNPELGHRRRRFLVAAGLITVNIALGATVVGIKRRYAASEANYGTLDNPRFKVREDLGLEGTKTYRERLKAHIAAKDISTKDLERYEVAISKVQRNLDSLELALKRESRESGAGALSDEAVAAEVDAILSGRAANSNAESSSITAQMISKIGEQIQTSRAEHKRQIYAVLTRTSELLRREVAAAEIRTTLAGRSFTDLVSKFGKPEAFTREIIKQVTGLELPAEVTFEVREIDREGVGGTASEWWQEVVAEDGYFGEVVLTFAHEAGHLMALHNEESMRSGGRQRDEADIPNWEEACAYAFEAVAAEAIHQTELRPAKFLFGEYKAGLLDDFYGGQQSEECHRVGMAYFDAALTVLGSAAKAYNYLARHDELTPEMLNVIAENRALFKAAHAEGTPNLNSVEMKLRELDERFKSTIRVVGPPKQ